MNASVHTHTSHITHRRRPPRPRLAHTLRAGHRLDRLGLARLRPLLVFSLVFDVVPVEAALALHALGHTASRRKRRFGIACHLHGRYSGYLPVEKQAD